MKNKKILLMMMVVGLLGGCANYQYRNVSCFNCREQAQEEINLAADALFKFDRYTEKDLLDKGRATLNELANKLANGYAEISQIGLVGHTDRLGSDEYNRTLGLNRAKTIRSYLKSHGITVDISVDSAGESEPVTDGCYGVSPKSKLTACLQPDRRVVVKISGVKVVAENVCGSESKALK